MKHAISFFIIFLHLKVTSETDLLDKIDNLIHDKNLIYNEFNSNIDDSIKYLSKGDPNSNLFNGNIKKDLDDSMTNSISQNQNGIENNLLINNVSSSPTENSSISNSSRALETLPNNFNNYQENNFQNPVLFHENNPAININPNMKINNNSSMNSNQLPNQNNISSSNSQNANDSFYNSNFNANLNRNNNTYNNKYFTPMVPLVNNNNIFPQQHTQIPNIQNSFSNGNIPASYINQPQANNLLSSPMVNYGKNNLINMNTRMIPEDRSDVIFEHLFIDLNGEKELPNLKSKWIYDNYNNEFIVPEESKYYAIYF
jgi:hypothetical protein